MLSSSREMRLEPAALMLFWILFFYDLAIVLLRKTEVAQRYLNYSGVIPYFSRSYHFR